MERAVYKIVWLRGLRRLELGIDGLELLMFEESGGFDMACDLARSKKPGQGILSVVQQVRAARHLEGLEVGVRWNEVVEGKYRRAGYGLCGFEGVRDEMREVYLGRIREMLVVGGRKVRLVKTV